MNSICRLTILFAAVLIALASCDKQEDLDRAYTDFRYDIVTYLGQNATGAVFEYLGHGDSVAVKLQSKVSLDTTVKMNQRVMLRYDFADNVASTSRDINVFGCSAIISDSLRRAQQPDSLPAQPVKLRSLWRTGEFINLHCQVEYTEKSRTFMLVADETTLDHDTVCCYLVHDLRGYQGTFWRDCYASFNVGALWRKPSFKCMRIIVNDLTYPDTWFYDFKK